MDTVSKERRSEIMSHVKSVDTKPEMIVRRFLFASGLRFRLHDKSLPGKPDIILPRYHTAIFVHGCFWHGHKECNRYVMPKTNKKFWYSKIDNNMKRDKKKAVLLRKLGWHVYTVWECNLTVGKRDKTLAALLKRITANEV